MKRRLFNTLSALSLLLCLVVAVVMWVSAGSADAPALDWKGTLVDAIRDADRLEITAIQEYPEEKPEKPFTIEGTDKIKSLLDLVEVDAKRSTGHCMCDGDTKMRFLKGNDLLAELSHHHGVRLRWHHGKWPCDAEMTPACQAAFPKWFAEQGYDRFQRMRDLALAAAERDREETDKFFSFFPENVRTILSGEVSGSATQFEGDEKALGEAAAKAVGDGRKLAAMVCRALGTTSESWSSTGSKERRAIAAMATVADGDFAGALDDLKDDKIGLLGAARFFFFEEYDKKVAAAKRDEWAVRLAEVVLADDRDDNKPIAMRHLKAIKSSEATTLLRNVMEGKVGKEGKPSGPKFGEPSLRAEATLCLACRKDASVKGIARQRLEEAESNSDRAAYEISLALLGDPRFIRKEHFDIESYSIGYAALQAIEQFKGVHGMDALVEGGFEHPWAAVREEAVVVFERITGKTFWDRAPNSRSSWYIKDAKAWWAKNGKQFVEGRRKQVSADQTGQSGQ